MGTTFEYGKYADPDGMSWRPFHGERSKHGHCLTCPRDAECPHPPETWSYPTILVANMEWQVRKDNHRIELYKPEERTR